MASRAQFAIAILTALYLLYLLKTVLGINLSHRYSAPKVLKTPIANLRHWG
ncbi:MAG: hypothetical protein VKK04_02615 [Synechococcales bacterium]|nr:hypothetical protein [Synechococcales bacterium]